MRQTGVFRYRLTARPILLYVIDRRIINVLNCLAANRTCRIDIEEVLLERLREATRLFSTNPSYLLEGEPPFVESFRDCLGATR